MTYIAPPTDVRRRPLAHKSTTNSRSINLAGGYSTTRVTLRTSFKVKGQGHKLASFVRLISASS